MHTQYQKALKPDDVAEILQLNKTTIYRKIRSGDIPAKKFGKEYRIPFTYIYYFQTGMDYDIAQKEKIDAEILNEYSNILDDVRKTS